MAKETLTDNPPPQPRKEAHMTTAEMVAERFAGEVAELRLTVRHDDGPIRHVSFRRPGSGNYWFELVTWPGALCIRGDMGTYVFSRLPDMFEFFRSDHDFDAHYWAQKVTSGRDQISEYSPEMFRRVVNEVVKDYNETTDDDPQAVRELLAEVRVHVLPCADDPYEAQRVLYEFEHNGFTFTDSCDYPLTDHTYQFLWCLHAIQWGIKQYDAAKDAGPTGT